MSVQFGRWDLEGQSPALEYIEKVSATLAPYGPDSNESYSKGGVTVLYRAFCTTKESRRETQPHICASGTVITWDGRLDNRGVLIGELGDTLAVSPTDLEVVAAAYEKWGLKCMGKLIGDWALAIWSPGDRLLILAKDFVGMRHLYYSISKDHVAWSTVLDPLVVCAEKSFSICEEYVAGWLSYSPAAHLSPYIGIEAVPPSSVVLLRNCNGVVQRTVRKYWDFDPGKTIRYRSDAGYEEHFRASLATAVLRRLRADLPVLAELSGGMDSSSIVCMADVIIAGGQAECSCLDTISWYDDSYDQVEPDSNELRWISRIEEQRGKAGFHINIGTFKQREAEAVIPRDSFGFESYDERFAAIPTSNIRHAEFFMRCKSYIQSKEYRVTLSGIGGDEPTGGGVPTPTPELQNLLARGQCITLARQLNSWAIKMRKTRRALLWEAVQGFFSAQIGAAKETRPAPWLHPHFVSRNRSAFRGYPSRVRLFGPLPSFQDHIDKLEASRRFLAYCCLSSELLREVRYPYYDRDFLEFMYAIPREQIVRVGQRRSLMKRALVGIVPDELLSRRRKKFVPPEPRKNRPTEWPGLSEIGQPMIASSLGIIDSDVFGGAFQKARHNLEDPTEDLTRTLMLEAWLRHITIQGDQTKPQPLKDLLVRT